MTKKENLKILLANPPWYSDTKPWLWGVRAGSRWPHMQQWREDRALPSYLPFPHFLAQAAAILEQHNNMRVSLVDSVALGERKSAFLGRAASFQPDIIFIETSTPSHENDLELARKLKQLLPDSIIGMGGAHGMLSEISWLKNHADIDFACFGEYEKSLEEYVISIQDSAEKPIAGVNFRGKNSHIVSGPFRHPCEDLDSLPRYAYHHLPVLRYADNPFRLPSPSAQVWSSRGCPFKCSFCVWPQVLYKQRKFRERSIPKVVDEIEWLISSYGFRSFYFDDDTTNINKKRTAALAAEIKKRNLGVPWAMMARADLMDKPTLEILHDAGMRAVKYGVEAAEPELVKNCGKALNLSKVKNVCAWTKELGIRTHLTFMFGLPGETEETAEKTIQLALELNPDQLQFSLCTPFPGTEFYRQADEKGWITEKPSLDGFNDAALNLPSISSDRLSNIIKDARQRWAESQLANTPEFNSAMTRIRNLEKGTRLAVYGTGKHTARLFPKIKPCVSAPEIEFKGFIDDNASMNQTYSGYPAVKPEEAANWGLDAILLSSDAYEDIMAEKAGLLIPEANLIRIYTHEQCPA